MDFNKLKEDNGLYLYETDYFVSNYINLFFKINSDLRNIFISRIFCLMLLENNDVLGARNDILKKARMLYGIDFSLSNRNEGGQLFFNFKFEYLDGSVVLEDYSDDVYKFIHDLLFNVSMNEDNLLAVKKKVLISAKNKLLKKDYLVDSIYYTKEISESLIGKLYYSDIDNISEIIDSITLDEVKNFYDQLLSDDSFYRGYAVGRFDDKEYLKLRNAIPFKSSMELLDYSDTKFVSANDIEIDNDSFTESVIRVNYKYTGDNDCFAHILNRMLSTSSGLLHEILRDKYGLVYGSSCVCEINNDLIYITAKIDKSKKVETLDAIDEVFEMLHDEEIVKKYFKEIKLFLEEKIDTIREDAKIFNRCIDDYIIKNGNAFDIFEYYKFVCNYKASEFIDEINKLEKVNSFFYRGVK